ncbi:MAG: adenosylcobinamide-phosphate synthase CbiB [Proteobacteria bacterium]|nr:adenosylcobinamide-phosphate synthase CbiB [Pseudomonadota bacterium]
MIFISDWYILPAAFLLDFLLGDPLWMPHPVRWMGKAIEAFEPRFRAKIKNTRLAGLFFAFALISMTFVIGLMVLGLAGAVNPCFGKAIEIMMLYFAISAFSLKREALGVLTTLQGQGLVAAKKRLAMIVGRDVEPLDEEGVTRAALETVAENFVDGVLSPLFWAGIGGAPLAMAYKMVNTLDSMVGYKDETYKDFGWASATIDDLFNYIPARLSLLVISLSVWLGKGDWKQAWDIGLTQGRNHSSPNAGFPEACFAGALEVRLGGPNIYGGVSVDKPYIGSGFGPVTGKHLEQACTLLIRSSFVAVFVAMTLAHLVSLF